MGDFERSTNVSRDNQNKQGDKSDLTGTVAKHYNELQETGLSARSQSRIYHMRNFNNWTKSMLINDVMTSIKSHTGGRNLTVLDLCAGKGGDLLKWKKAGISKLVCADIAGISVQQAEDRFHEMIDRGRRDRYPQRMFDAEFITADCSKVRLKDKYKRSNIQFDLTSCQFSFHYSFESYAQADTMLRNACECLRPGGYFIGTTPDSNEILRRLREAPEDEFGSDVYRIKYLSDDKDNIPLFGAKYDFHLEGVVDCPEFLVHFPLLERMAEKYKMKLIQRIPFGKFYEQNISKREGRNLIEKMSALETYPGNEDTPLVSNNPEDYTEVNNAHQQKKTSADSTSHHRPDSYHRHDSYHRPQYFGTLSKSEWEAITLYLVFVFQKEPITVEGDKGEVSRKRPAGDRDFYDSTPNKHSKETVENT